MNATGGFIAGSIVAKLLLDKTGWNASIAGIKSDQRTLSSIATSMGAEFVRLVGAGWGGGRRRRGRTRRHGQEDGGGRRSSSSRCPRRRASPSNSSRPTNWPRRRRDPRSRVSPSAFGSSPAICTMLARASNWSVNTSIASASRRRDGPQQLPDVNATLLQIADRFAGMADGAEKNALAIKLLGRSGTELIPFLNRGFGGTQGGGGTRRETRGRLHDEDGDRGPRTEPYVQGPPRRLPGIPQYDRECHHPGRQ